MRSRPVYVVPLSAFAIISLSLFVAGKADPAWAAPQGQSSTAPSAAPPKKTAAPSTTPSAAPSATPSTTPEASEGPGWAVNCKSGTKDKGLECRLSQTVVTKGGQVLADVTFRIASDKKATEVITRLPLGLNLPAGVSLQVDNNAPQRLPFKACDRNGCYAQGSISPELWSTLQKGKQLQVSFQNLAEKTINVPLSLDGFPDAYAKI
jgi:invasion protein IalB